MTAVFSDELRARVEADFGRVVDLLGRKVALKSISAEGITAEHMKRSAEFVADELRQVGIDAKVVQSRNPDGTPGAWEVIGSKIVDPAGPPPCCCTRTTTCSLCRIRPHGTLTRSSPPRSARACTAAARRMTAAA